MPDPLLKKSPELSTSSAQPSVQELQRYFNTLAKAGFLPLSPSQPARPRPATTSAPKAPAVIDSSLPDRDSIARPTESKSLSPSISRRAAQPETTHSPPRPILSKDDPQPPSPSSKRRDLIRKFSSPAIPTILKGPLGKGRGSKNDTGEISFPTTHIAASSSSIPTLPKDAPFRALAGQLKDFRNSEYMVSQYADNVIIMLKATLDRIKEKGRAFCQKPGHDLLKKVITHCQVIADGHDFWAREIPNDIANGSQTSILPAVAHEILLKLNTRIATCGETKIRLESMVWLILQMQPIQLVIDSFTETDAQKLALKDRLSQIALRCSRLPLPVQECVPILEKYLPDEETIKEMRNLGAASLLTKLKSLNTAINNQRIRPASDITKIVNDIMSIIQESTQEEGIKSYVPSSFATVACDQSNAGGLEALPSGSRAPSIDFPPLPRGIRPKGHGFSQGSQSAPQLFPPEPPRFSLNDCPPSTSSPRK